MATPAPAKSTNQRDAVTAKLREAYRQSRIAARSAERARTATVGDLREAFILGSKLASEKAMAAIEAAAKLLEGS